MRLRAEQVGSLLRPRDLLAARAAHAQGRLDLAVLRAKENESIRAAVTRQRALGLDVFAAASIAANQKGVDAVNHENTDGSASTPPRNGPTMKPTPNAAPMSPKFFVRSSGFVTSAMDACATDRLPPVMPSSARDRNSSGMFLMTMPVANSA